MTTYPRNKILFDLYNNAQIMLCTIIVIEFHQLQTSIVCNNNYLVRLIFQ